MAKHTPQWRVDMAMLVETLEHAQEAIAWHTHAQKFENSDGVTLERAIELAIKLGKQYQVHHG